MPDKFDMVKVCVTSMMRAYLCLLQPFSKGKVYTDPLST